MKTVYILSANINNSATTKVERFRFNVLHFKNAVKEIKTEKEKLIDYWKWFNSVKEAEQYLEKL